MEHRRPCFHMAERNARKVGRLRSDDQFVDKCGHIDYFIRRLVVEYVIVGVHRLVFLVNGYLGKHFGIRVGEECRMYQRSAPAEGYGFEVFAPVTRVFGKYTHVIRYYERRERALGKCKAFNLHIRRRNVYRVDILEHKGIFAYRPVSVGK